MIIMSSLPNLMRLYLLRSVVVLSMSSMQAFAFQHNTKHLGCFLHPNTHPLSLPSSFSRSSLLLFGHDINNNNVEIRNWKKGEGRSIINLLQSVEDGNGLFNSEGPLDMDCITEDLLQESYSKDGACLLVATTEEEENNRLIGTAALTVGTSVTYLKSGASLSFPENINGAIRRVCATNPTVLQRLLESIENRAKDVGVAELIVLAYKTTTTTTTTTTVCQPNSALLENMGYKASTINLGNNVIQYAKFIESNNNKGQKMTIATTEKDDSKEIILGVTVGAAFLTVILAFIGITSFMGLELIPSSNNNRGAGSPLSVQELQILRQEEKLQRTDLDGRQANNNNDGDANDGDRGVRQWSDLSSEEKQEEMAMMKVIQGQNSRLQ